MTSKEELEINKLSLEDDTGEALTKQELFGGAITLSIPTKWRDVSQVRQVPDHQEAYQDCTFKCGTKLDKEGTGGCVIVEILERQDLEDAEAAKYFFTDLAEANGNGDVIGKVLSQKVWDIGYDPKIKIETGKKLKLASEKNLIPNLSARVKGCSCIGFQSIAPLKNQAALEEGKASIVRLELFSVRLESIQTDLLITLSMPMNVGGVEKEIADAGNGNGNSHDFDEKEEDQDPSLSRLFLDILSSLQVDDWSLFA
mmetsp:Transcript_2557/g.3778  ORF Transcript_2557/g.3778 Transcript_2557/m.3778 type:complete len:256 (-) Transcript_2557:100-867(-)|eukprot:CAMPEP_0194108654 /NCGR_PEP_ID=MMETSP0150-20130528/8317_1 /TAXON_ID=122233 /ORGANISM="Chaetoceros debilis, Strain MM31A-1" /LENGTH=255 /DNA_ID=CAMNT_0038797411 /DNA_START=89 /DNA_END=856 /DNA_ORIENTATION=-